MHHYARDQYDDDDTDGDAPRGPTAQQLRDLEHELLARLILVGGVSSIRELFAGFAVPWAYSACDRLEDRGLVALQEDRRTAVTPAGYEAHRRETSATRRDVIRRTAG